jgi:hypothetical protein
MAEKAPTRRGPKDGVTMPCGWGCGALLRATDVRRHWQDCPRRPEPPRGHIAHPRTIEQAQPEAVENG